MYALSTGKPWYWYWTDRCCTVFLMENTAVKTWFIAKSEFTDLFRDSLSILDHKFREFCIYIFQNILFKAWNLLITRDFYFSQNVFKNQKSKYEG
jgi:hypothetical protein